MAIYKRGKVWWYKFTWKTEPIRESTKQSNKRVAEQIEAARKTQLAKGEVNIRDKKPVPTTSEGQVGAAFGHGASIAPATTERTMASCPRGQGGSRPTPPTAFS